MIKKKILIVEDESSMRQLLSIELKSAGYDVFQACDGQEGLAMAKDIRPDLILCDVMMPKMDGNQLMKALKASEFGKNIPFIILTARGTMRDYFEVMDIEDFIVKPFEAHDLLMKVQKAVYKNALDSSQRKSQDTLPASKRRILVLDEENTLFLSFRKIFENEYNYECRQVSTLGACFETAIFFEPCLILSHAILNHIKPDQFVLILKEMPRLSRVPVIIYSYTEAEGRQKEILQAGAADFIGQVTEEKLINETLQLLHKYYPEHGVL